MKIRIVSVLLSAIIALSALGGCASKPASANLVGRWVNEEEQEDITFFDDGTCFDHSTNSEGTYAVADGQLKISSVWGFGKASVCEYTVSGNKLTLIYEGETLTLTRYNSQSSQSTLNPQSSQSTSQSEDIKDTPPINEIVPCKYDGAWAFSDGMAMIRVGNNYGFIDKNGKEVVPCKYDEAGDFSEGMAAVKLDGKWGYISHP